MGNSEEEKCSEIMGHISRDGDILGGRGDAQIRNYFSQIIRNRGCESLETKVAWDRIEWRRVIASNQSQECIFNDDDSHTLFIILFIES